MYTAKRIPEWQKKLKALGAHQDVVDECTDKDSIGECLFNLLDDQFDPRVEGITSRSSGA
eukprot:1655597-Karenia_brevis.AAC.2